MTEPLKGYVSCNDPACEANQMPLHPDGSRGYAHSHPEGSTWIADREAMASARPSVQESMVSQHYFIQPDGTFAHGLLSVDEEIAETPEHQPGS